MSGERLIEQLHRKGWLKPGFLDRALEEEQAAEGVAPLDAGRPESALLRLCDAGALEGGLSTAWDLSPEELVGPLTVMLGGAARRLRVVDVREKPELELSIFLDGKTERWAVQNAEGLAHNLNDLFRDQQDVRAVAVLGEWQDMLQLWCVPKPALPALLRERFFDPRNREALQGLLESR